MRSGGFSSETDITEIFKKPCVYLTLAALLSAALSLTLELCGVRTALGFGGGAFSFVGFLAGGVFFFVVSALILTGTGKTDFDEEDCRHRFFYILCVLFCLIICMGAAGGLHTGANTRLFFALAAIISLALAFWEFLIFTRAKPRIWLMLAAYVSLAFGCGIFASLSFSDTNYIRVISAMCFNFLVFYFVLRARRAQKIIGRSFLLSAASLAFMLSFISRPTAALMCAAAAPAVINIVLFETKKAAGRCALMIPAVLIGAAIIVTFNYLRPGALFDFGGSYWYAAGDISENILDLRLLPAAFRHYVFQLPERIDSFPFFKPSYLSLDYGRYVYLDRTLGALVFPVTAWLGLGPFFIRYGRGSLERIATFAAGAVMICVVIYVDFCFWGVSMRCLFDFLPLWSILGSVLILRVEGDARRVWARYAFRLAAVFCFCVSTIMTLGIIFAHGGV